MKATAIYFAMALGALLVATEARAQDLMGENDTRLTETYIFQFSLVGDQLVFDAQTPGIQTILSKDRCIGSISSEPSSALSSYLFHNSINATKLTRGNASLDNEYAIQHSVAGQMKTDLYVAACGPVQIQQGAIVNAAASQQFLSVGVDTAGLVQDGHSYIQNAPQRAVEEAKQAKANAQFLYTVALYSPEGIMMKINADDMSAYPTAAACRLNVLKHLAAAKEQAPLSRLVGDSVIFSSDGTGSLWFGCITVGAMGSDAMTNYLDIQMTEAKAKTMRMVPGL